MRVEIWGIKFPVMFLTGAKIIAVVLVLVLLHFVLKKIFTKNQKSEPEKSVYLYPKSIRIWHWTNMITFTVLLVTGLCEWLKVIPKEVFLATHLSFSAMFIFTWVYLVAYNAKNFSSYRITKETFKEAFSQMKYYLFGVFKGEKCPHIPTKEDKFNALQKLSYFFMLYVLMPLFIATGVLEQIKPIHNLMMEIHIYFCTFVSILFVIAHVYMVFSGSYLTQKLKAMIDGNARY